MPVERTPTKNSPSYDASRLPNAESISWVGGSVFMGRVYPIGLPTRHRFFDINVLGIQTVISSFTVYTPFQCFRTRSRVRFTPSTGSLGSAPSHSMEIAPMYFAFFSIPRTRL